MLNFPDDTRRVTVFDTNAYRQLCHNATPADAKARARQLVARERANGIQALAFPPVLMELLAHLSDPADPSYLVAHAAVVAAVEHCAMPLDGDRHVAIWASPDLHLCMTFWQKQPQQLLGGDDLIRAMAKAIADDPTEDCLDRMREDLRTVRKIAAGAEAEFATGMKQHLMNEMIKSAAARGATVDRNLFRQAFIDYLHGPAAAHEIAKAHVLCAASYIACADDVEEISRKANALQGWFPAALSLYLQVVRKIATSNWDLTKGKGANLLWDLQVAFLVGPEHTIDGRPATVVTGDGEIRHAARAVNVDQLVVTYPQYRESIRASLPPST